MATRKQATRKKAVLGALSEIPGPVAAWYPILMFLLAVGSSATGAAYFSHEISSDAFLPVMSGVLFASAALLAAIGWPNQKAKSDTVTCWDVAGAVTLIGCAAAMMAEPENVMQVFGLKQNN